MTPADTALWRDAAHLPETLALLTDQAQRAGGHFAATLDLLGGRRIVTVGNGAAHYAGLAMQAAAWRLPGPEVVAVPAGTLLAGGFAWRSNDTPLVISSSGSLRDVIELVESGVFPHRYAMLTSSPDSPLARRASAIVRIETPPQQSATHTCCYLGNVAAALHLYAALAGAEIPGLAEVGAPVARALAGAEQWASAAASDLARSAPARGAVAFATGAGIPAAYETALLLKEVSGIACEGMDAREAATSGMYALDPHSLVLGHAARGDEIAAETHRICAAREARTLAIPGIEAGQELLAPLTTFPAALALAIELAQAAGRDVDHPAWEQAYYATARSSTARTAADSEERP